jgi:cytochrome c-type biogenesis protein CcmE
VTPRLWGVVFVVLAALGFLVFKGLGDATTFFKNADEAVAQRDELGTKRFRLQGTVVAGSLDKRADGTTFEVEYHCAVVEVRHTGGQAPPQFDENIPVVLEGHFAAGSDVYRSDRIIVKHTAEYRTKEKDRLALADQESRSTNCPTTPAPAAAAAAAK